MPSYSCRVSIGNVRSGKTTGSFMSFHRPQTPISSMSFLYSSAHQSRTAGEVKSGKLHSPGQTSSDSRLPSERRQK